MIIAFIIFFCIFMGIGYWLTKMDKNNKWKNFNPFDWFK